MKADLVNRIKLREEVPREEYAALQREAGLHPVVLDGSISSELWQKYMLPKEALRQPDNSSARTIDDLEPEIQEQLRRAMTIFDAQPDR